MGRKLDLSMWSEVGLRRFRRCKEAVLHTPHTWQANLAANRCVCVCVRAHVCASAFMTPIKFEIAFAARCSSAGGELFVILVLSVTIRMNHACVRA